MGPAQSVLNLHLPSLLIYSFTPPFFNPDFHKLLSHSSPLFSSPNFPSKPSPSLSLSLSLSTAMDIDPEDLFRDSDNSDDEFLQEREPSKEFVVYLVDASPKMFLPASKDVGKGKTHFHVAISCISQSLKTQIINRSYDEVSICFFNTREKKNLQDLSGVYVFDVMDREFLDRPTARLIKEFDNVEETLMKEIGSQYGINADARENSLYNALWVAQALLRKGSIKTSAKRMLMITNEDDPFGKIVGAAKSDMIRTTLQRAKDAQDLGISFELLPLSMPDDEFNVSIFYADMIGLEGNEVTQFLPSAGEKLQSERSFICADTGALLQEPAKLVFPYKSKDIKFSTKELSELKRVSSGHLRLLGFKPLSCLKDYHNLRPSTFIFPSDEELIGSTRIFIALHRSMLRLGRFALAFYGSSSHPQMVALVAQEEITSSSGQVEPPGMHMIYLPYSDDIRHVEEARVDNDAALWATEDQIKKASVLLKRINLKEFSVCQFANPALQRHYGILQALALDEDEMPEIKDETLPDEEALSRPGIANAIEEFKVAVYGENYEEESKAAATKTSGPAAKKRKVMAETAVKECANYDWPDLAENGKLKERTVVELKFYLTAHSLPVSGKKEDLISRILTHMGK
ncbi:ATP-dependent DNA helicase 2 subunit KU70 [Acorus gramineus]|uniref:ATP-dependent DNA helicase 2 subunit KU70 n=1 Tax=Acorus gramineus TaxID=55184 RepID=A0AAV9B380_ACOGR|nr:ATP-dependent DNA helicase 2 subunit KU70 [Acorus gramineus]